MFASLKNKIKEETGNEIPSTLPPPVQLPSTSSSSSSSTQSTRLNHHHSQRQNNGNVNTTITNTNNHNLSNNNSNNSNNNGSSRLSSSTSITSFNENIQDNEIILLRKQCNDLKLELKDVKNRFDNLTKEYERLEKTNEILLESVKVSQQQKDLIVNEQEKIQNQQQAEIVKLKSLLSFREQEACDQLSKIKQYQQQIENLTTELERLKLIEPTVEDLQDELERFRHASQLDKNNLTTTLAAVEEENRHLKTRLQIIDQSRLESILSLSSNEKVQALIHERKLLEQHLEEAHLQLSDIKSSWSGQNLALETQVSRLSRQVAEETTEKRKAIKASDEYLEKIKQLEFKLQKSNEEIEQRNNKIKLLEEEIDDVLTTLKECREENEENILYSKNKAETYNQEINDLKLRLSNADDRLTEYISNSEIIITSFQNQITNLTEQLDQTTDTLEIEREEKLTALLRNAEISQSEEILKKELRIERDEINELNDKIQELKLELKQKSLDIQKLNDFNNELNTVMNIQKDKLAQNEKLNLEISEKNKTIKILNQRLLDLKKTLQEEIKCSSHATNNVINSYSTNSPLLQNENYSISNQQQQQIQQNQKNSLLTNNGDNNKNFHNNELRTNSCEGDNIIGGPIVMDEVNFKYLKHVIVKFLTSREVEARHLIRAVATLLRLTHEEEKLLHDTLNWKISWFGAKPDHGSGQRAFSIPPS